MTPTTKRQLKSVQATSRRRELAKFARAYGFDTAWMTDGNPVDAYLAMLIKAENGDERDLMFKHFWRAFLEHRPRRLRAEARKLRREGQTA